MIFALKLRTKYVKENAYFGSTLKHGHKMKIVPNTDSCDDWSKMVFPTMKIVKF